MKHFLYRITNKINQRFYVGMHSTENVDDGYLGSGKRLKFELNKYGKENFVKEILEELPSRKSLEYREREIVNDEFRKDPLCLNLKNGGEGGGRFWSEEHRLKALAASHKSPNRDHHAISVKRQLTFKERGSNLGVSKSSGFSGKFHTEETKRKLSVPKGIGEKNSQFGTCWVVKQDVRPIKIKKEQLDEYIQNGYSRGRIL